MEVGILVFLFASYVVLLLEMGNVESMLDRIIKHLNIPETGDKK